MLRAIVTANVELHHISMESEAKSLADVAAAIEGEAPFDIIIIDGLYRPQTLRLTLSYLKDGGAVICDNSDGYGFFEEIQRNGLKRVDFFGFAPGVVNRHCTSIAFRQDCFLFASGEAIPRAAEIAY